jgi:GDP-mannose 4,6-dehydratase
MERVVITGATGFLGSHLTERLVGTGVEVKVVVHRGSSHTSRLKGQVDVVRRDIIRSTIPISDASTVFHLAAVSHVGHSIENPRRTFEANTIGTFNVLESVRKSDSVEKFVFVSTAHVYGIPQYLPIDEGHPTYPREPYSASKLAAEGFTLAYGKSYGIPVCIARLFNVFGPRQAQDFVVPVIIEQMLETDVMSLGNLKPTRDFTYVDDVINGLILMGQQGDGIYNVGSGKEVSIESLVESIAEILGKRVSVSVQETRKRSKGVEIERMWADISRLKSLGWQPEIELIEGLKKTVKWYRNNL